GKTYLGKVSRLADFGAFVEIIPGTDGLLHISEVAEHRIKDIRDELKEGDQVLVKVLSIEGNRIRLSRKAILKEQRAKMGGGGAEAPEERAAGSMTIEGGGEYTEEEHEPNFNRVEAHHGGEGRPAGGREGRPGGDRGRGGRGHNGRGGRGGGRRRH
ncbi:MAG TPA: S1 RNA-binding domain-containing protein, partial [Terriglobales bacterium]|nr:S1 RNA-binding domain-containing protein [Terriglobales bacterium]